MDRGRLRAKLRRGRALTAGAEIRSQLPAAADPRSRVSTAVAPAVLPAGVVDARDAARPLAPGALADQVLCGDAAQVLRRLPAASCACAITSPPYWNTVDYGIPGQIGPGPYEDYLTRMVEVFAETARVLIPNGKLCVNVPLLPLPKRVSTPLFGRTHTRVLLDLYADLKPRLEAAAPLRLYSVYIWEKQTTEKMFGSYPFPPNLYERNFIEYIAVFVKPGPPRVLPAAVKAASRLTQAEWMDLTRQVWWMYPENVPRLAGHPAPFPEALPNRLIAMYTFGAAPQAGFPGDLVLDPLCGSGTVCVAARRQGRRFLGVDLNPAFCATAAARAAATPVAPAVLSGRRPAERRD